eukprot:2107032-Karenia_brevis.AAC.1
MDIACERAHSSPKPESAAPNEPHVKVQYGPASHSGSIPYPVNPAAKLGDNVDQKCPSSTS